MLYYTVLVPLLVIWHSFVQDLMQKSVPAGSQIDRKMKAKILMKARGGNNILKLRE